MQSWNLRLSKLWKRIAMDSPREHERRFPCGDGLSGNNEKWEKMIEGMHTYTPDELETHLTAAGFRDIAVHRDESKHWLCVTAVK